MNCRLFDLAGAQRTGRGSRDGGIKIFIFFISLVKVLG